MKFEEIYSLSTENHGIVTSYRARELGVRDKDLMRWVKIGRLMKIGYGVYRTTQYPFSEDDAFANAVAVAGPKAYLCGESVLGLLKLMTAVDLRRFHVAVPVRCRRKLPQEIKVEIHSAKYVPTKYDGIPIQKPADAIRQCIGGVMSSRLEDATNEAYRTGKIFKEQHNDLLTEIRRHA